MHGKATLNCVLMIAVLSAGSLASAEETEQEASDRFLPTMRQFAEAITVRRKDADGPNSVQLIGKPIFRYSDQPRRIFDGTLWLWVESGRPVAMQKIEASRRGNGDDAWTFCFASFSTGLLDVSWPGGRTYDTSEGIRYEPVPEPPEAAQSARLLRRQLHLLTRRFQVEIVNAPAGENTEQMRLLPRPLYEYGGEESDVLAGAVFACACNGTNPDAYLVLEVRRGDSGRAEWHYAFVRMTTGGLTARLDDRVVWSEKWVAPVPTQFESWTFFFEPRDLD